MAAEAWHGPYWQGRKRIPDPRCHQSDRCFCWSASLSQLMKRGHSSEACKVPHESQMSGRNDLVLNICAWLCSILSRCLVIRMLHQLMTRHGCGP